MNRAGAASAAAGSPGEAGAYDRSAAEAAAKAYDEEAEATGWFGPQVALGLVYERLRPGQTLLDLGIGTGLSSVLFRKAGLRVYGLDVDEAMLEVCRWKGFGDLTRHDLTERPYPYDSKSFDHVVCLGVLPFLADPSPVFSEAARVLKPGGTFTLLAIDRIDQEPGEVVVGPEHTHTGASVTMHRHSGREVGGWLNGSGFTLVRSLPFIVYRDRARAEGWRVVCYVAAGEE